MKCSQLLYENIAGFLLTCPVDEIGYELVADIVQSFQLKMISRKDAISLIVATHKSFLEQFIQMTMVNLSSLEGGN